MSENATILTMLVKITATIAGVYESIQGNAIECFLWFILAVLVAK